MTGLPHNQERSGFSLAELLVVMAVITILVAVLAPVAIQSRNHARSTACVANLKQLAGAIMLYAQDWSDRLPRLDGNPFASSWPTDRYPEGTSATCLKASLGSRIASDGVCRCLNDVGAPEYGFSQPRAPVFGATGSSYLAWSTARAGRYSVRLNGHIVQMLPSRQTCLLCDYGTDWHGVRSRDGLDLVSSARVNAAYADGHAGHKTAFSVDSGKGKYVSFLDSAEKQGGRIRIVGKSAYGSLEVGGNIVPVGPSGAEPDTVRISVSGEIATDNGLYEIDRVFTFAGQVQVEHAIRQMVMSLEAAYGD